MSAELAAGIDRWTARWRGLVWLGRQQNWSVRRSALRSVAWKRAPATHGLAQIHSANAAGMMRGPQIAEVSRQAGVPVSAGPRARICRRAVMVSKRASEAPRQ